MVDEPEKGERGFEVVAQTRLSSGSIIETLGAIAAVGGVCAPIIAMAWGRLKAAEEVAEERKENLRKLFLGIAQECDLVLTTYPQLASSSTGSKFNDCDVRVVGATLQNLKGIGYGEVHERHVEDFKRSDQKKLEGGRLQLDPSFDHVYFSRSNPFVDFIFSGSREGLPQKDLELVEIAAFTFPYRFEFIDDNWCISKWQEDKRIRVWRPKYSPNVRGSYVDSGKGGYPVDYLTVMKLPGIFLKARANGHEDWVVAGVHRQGTEGFGLLLEDNSLIDEITRQIGTSRYWQIVLEVHSSPVTMSGFYGSFEKIVGTFRRYNKMNDHKFEPILKPEVVKLVEVVSLEG